MNLQQQKEGAGVGKCPRTLSNRYQWNKTSGAAIRPTYSEKALKNDATWSGHGPCSISNCLMSSAGGTPTMGIGDAQVHTTLTGGTEGTIICTQNIKGAGLFLH